MAINWDEAPDWADRVVKFSGKDDSYWAGCGNCQKIEGTIVYVMGNDDYEILSIRPDAWQEGEDRMNNIAQNGSDGEHYGEVVKQERYKKADGMDKIDEWARDKTRDQFRTIMWAMCEKYESRLGKKDAIVKEVGKMADYMSRWHLYEQKWAGEE